MCEGGEKDEAPVGESSGEGEEERRETSPLGSVSFVAMVARWGGVKEFG